MFADRQKKIEFIGREIYKIFQSLLRIIWPHFEAYWLTYDVQFLTASKGVNIWQICKYVEKMEGVKTENAQTDDTTVKNYRNFPNSINFRPRPSHTWVCLGWSSNRI